MRFFLLLTVLLCSVSAVSSQVTWDKEYDKYLFPIETTDPNVATNDDLIIIDNVLGGRQIVALGEATHGTKEFVTTRHRLIKRLITEHGFRVFVMEDDFTSSLEIDQLLTGEVDGDITKVISKNWMGAWRNKEMVSILNWIKEFNKNREKEEMVRVYGCDMTWYSFAAKKMLSELRVNNLLSRDIEIGLVSLMKYDRRKKMKKSQKQTINKMLDLLQTLFSDLDIENNKQLGKLNIMSKTLVQSLDYYSSKGFMKTIKRDKYMAENCKYIFQLEKHKKMIIWGHNQHIANKSDNSAKPPMGSYLKKQFVDKYYALGFAFFKGEFTTYNPTERKSMACPAGEPNVNCVDVAFADAQYPNFFIDFMNPIVLKHMPNLLVKKVLSRSGGALYFPVDDNRNYRKHILSKSYDGLIFIRNSTATTLIPSSN
ncbi:erythromycin esterase family protein [Ancylomarina salipaludis]|uniref:Erythromycin esterase family protein n=1 Tax=Ancylomarina salipaludis TaxID=2501299 RepID=A0A4Q1JPW1_9BACT|nr:erythromycin esterase family protein [Ancylomarina salipaludis]RXQ97403.1 erythromycin esterase family protein [Ancylomarina salipaludis]